MTTNIQLANYDIECIEDQKNKHLIQSIIHSACEIKAFDFTALDVSKVFQLSDYFVLLSGRSDRHVQGIVNRITSDLSQIGIKPVAIEGLDKAHWVLIDYGNVIVHVFYEQVRYNYNLEALWLNAGKISLDKYLKSINHKDAA